ncbi:zinc finger transcription factor 1 [Fusarium albosuccineum]|uniref:Zinc finger transcription factor 1 n=1 Tax=Fusarium albosuccineum TaxID=1237068 RepID=A0A8H4LEP8_9HYPO|nr:zinc finger transcription factor 1 [Fusarium albosuccineum]
MKSTVFLPILLSCITPPAGATPVYKGTQTLTTRQEGLDWPKCSKTGKESCTLYMATGDSRFAKYGTAVLFDHDCNIKQAYMTEKTEPKIVLKGHLPKDVNIFVDDQVRPNGHIAYGSEEFPLGEDSMSCYKFPGTDGVGCKNAFDCSELDVVTGGAQTNHTPQQNLAGPTRTISTTQTIGVPSTLLFKLVDLYFSHVYNASLLLHQPSFIQSLSQDTASKQVVLSTCAIASCFYGDDNQHNTIVEEGFAHEWAEEAGRLAFSDIECPTEDKIVTFLNLALFWYNQGQWQRMMVFEANAQCTARLLGLGNSSTIHGNTVEAELSRRRLWACFLINQFASRTASNKIKIAEFRNFPLPCNEQGFKAGNIPEPDTAWTFEKGTPSFNAELIKLGSLWTSAHLLACDDGLEIGQKLQAIQKLDTELRVWKQALPKDFEIDPNCTRASSAAIAFSQKDLIHIAYHQTASVLHSSIVPLLSLSSAAGEYGYSQAISAQTALSHAREISSFFIQLGSWDLSKAPGFVGYAAYSSCAIQIPFLWCQKAGVKQNSMTNIQVNLHVLRAIGKRWKLVAELLRSIPVLYHYHKSLAYSLADEPASLDAIDLNRRKGVTKRARTSILGHNEVIWSNGSVQNLGVIDSIGLDVIEDESGCRAEVIGPSDMSLEDLIDPSLMHFDSVEAQLEGPASRHLSSSAIVEAWQACEELDLLVPAEDSSLWGVHFGSPGGIFEAYLEDALDS